MAKVHEECGLPVVYKDRGKDCSSILIGGRRKVLESESRRFHLCLRGRPGRKHSREVRIIGVIFPL